MEALGEGWLSRSMDYLLAFPLTVGFYGSLPPVCGAMVGFLVYHILERMS